MTYFAFLQKFTALLSSFKFYNLHSGQIQPGGCISRAAVTNTVAAEQGTRGSWQFCLAYCWQDGFLHVLEWMNFPPSYRRRNILLFSVRQFLERSQIIAQWCGTQRELSHRGKSSCVNKFRNREVPLWGSSKPASCRTHKVGRIKCTESQTLKGYTREKEIYIQK